jgi:hypothetical protein
MSMQWTAQRHRNSHRPAVARTLLVTLGLPHEPSAFAPARDPPQAELLWDDPS